MWSPFDNAILFYLLRFIRTELLILIENNALNILRLNNQYNYTNVINLSIQWFEAKGLE